MAVLKTAVLISGRGSNMQALIEAAQKTDYPARITCVISNEPEAPGLLYARQAKIPAFAVNHRDFKDRMKFEEALDAELKKHGIELVCLAGFMRVLTAWFVDRWRDKLINIHPSLLPAFPGLDTHKKALEYGAKFSGCTVHFVRAELDHGPIILQAAVPVAAEDTEKTLAARILESEHRLYPEAVRLIALGCVNVHEERVFIAGAKMPAAALFNPDF